MDEEVPTVLNEDVLGVGVQAVLQGLLVAAHHVGTEYLLVVGLSQVGSGLPKVSLQQAAAALLRRGTRSRSSSRSRRRTRHRR